MSSCTTRTCFIIVNWKTTVSLIIFLHCFYKNIILWIHYDIRNMNYFKINSENWQNMKNMISCRLRCRKVYLTKGATVHRITHITPLLLVPTTIRLLFLGPGGSACIHCQDLGFIMIVHFLSSFLFLHAFNPFLLKQEPWNFSVIYFFSPKNYNLSQILLKWKKLNNNLPNLWTFPPIFFFLLYVHTCEPVPPLSMSLCYF